MSSTIDKTEKLLQIFSYYDKDNNDRIDLNEFRSIFNDVIRLNPSIRNNTIESFARSFESTDIDNNKPIEKSDLLNKSDFISSIRDKHALDDLSINVLYDEIIVKLPSPIKSPSKRNNSDGCNNLPTPPPLERSDSKIKENLYTDWIKQAHDHLNGLTNILNEIKSDALNQAQKDSVKKKTIQEATQQPQIVKTLEKSIKKAINEAKKEFGKDIFIRGQNVIYTVADKTRTGEIIEVMSFEYYKVKYERSVSSTNLSYNGRPYRNGDVYKKGDIVRFDRNGESKDGKVLHVIDGDYMLQFTSTVHYSDLSLNK
jgi:hypothetical protein